MAPGYGPPFIIDTTGEKRNATVEDVHNFCKLVQTSTYLDFNSSIVVQPNDVPAGNGPSGYSSGHDAADGQTDHGQYRIRNRGTGFNAIGAAKYGETSAIR